MKQEIQKRINKKIEKEKQKGFLMSERKAQSFLLEEIFDILEDFNKRIQKLEVKKKK